jgi:electron transfer flavoprotein alpha subunit
VKVWVVGETTPDSTGYKTTLEILTRARDLGASELAAVALGPGATDAAKAFGEHGAQKVYASDDAVFGDYIAQPAAHALHQLVQQEQPNLLLFPYTYDARDIAGRLAAKTGSTVMSNAVDVDGGSAKTAIFGGAQIVTVALEGNDPKIVLVRPKSFEASPSGGTAEIVSVASDVPEDAKKAKRTERHEAEASGPKLEDAAVVISGGRGLQQPENFKLLEDVAALIPNSAVGATRAVVDAGWVPYAMQVGQTGKTVKPKVYLAIGISGATQHIVGMKSSDRIIAVNKDAEAPIFQLADLGIVGDALKVVPKLAEEIKARKG